MKLIHLDQYKLVSYFSRKNHNHRGSCIQGVQRRNVPDFGRVFLMLKYTDTTQNTYVQS